MFRVFVRIWVGVSLELKVRVLIGFIGVAFSGFAGVMKIGRKWKKKRKPETN